MACSLDEQYIQTALKATETCERLAFKTDDWEASKTLQNSKEILMFKRKSENMEGRHAFKSEFEVNMNYKKAWEMCYPVTHLGEPWNRTTPKSVWDKQVEKAELFTLAGKNGVLRDDILAIRNYTRPQLKGMVSARDNLTVFKFKKTPKYYSYTLESVEHPECHPVKNYVRIHAFPSACFFLPHESDPENKSKGIIIFENDMRVAVVPITVLEAGIPTILLGYVQDVQSSAALPYESLAELPGMQGKEEPANM